MHEPLLLSTPLSLSDLDTTIVRGNAHFAAGRTREAILDYQRVLEQQPRNVHALHNLGLACFREDQVDRARQYLDRALTVAPERADI